jgi:hypothetical protein
MHLSGRSYSLLALRWIILVESGEMYQKTITWQRDGGLQLLTTSRDGLN